MPTRLKKAIAAIRAGNKTAAIRLLSKLIKDDPQDEDAWIWMARAVDTDSMRRYCLEQALAINPDNETAMRELAWLGMSDSEALMDQDIPPAPISPIGTAEGPVRHEPPGTVSAAHPRRNLFIAAGLLACGIALAGGVFVLRDSAPFALSLPAMVSRAEATRVVQEPPVTPQPPATVQPSATPQPPTETPVEPTAEPTQTPAPTQPPATRTNTVAPNTPAPTYTPYPTYTRYPTFTLAPTGTPRPTQSPLPTYTPWPTPDVPQVAAQPVDTATPYPTYTPYPTFTSAPSNTPNPTPTADLGASPTAQPSYTPYPTYTAQPTHTALPTYTLRPTYTPYPTATRAALAALQAARRQTFEAGRTIAPTETPLSTATPDQPPSPTATATAAVAPSMTPTPAQAGDAEQLRQLIADGYSTIDGQNLVIEKIYVIPARHSDAQVTLRVELEHDNAVEVFERQARAEVLDYARNLLREAAALLGQDCKVVVQDSFFARSVEASYLNNRFSHIGYSEVRSGWYVRRDYIVAQQRNGVNDILVWHP
ncbi:MAG: tetratricopeptide repeat protein [Anaerolineae bacterium]